MAHLSNKTWYNKQRPYVRINGFGDMIPGSIVFRDRPPKDGTWRQLGYINACCNGIGDSYLVVRNTTASTNITSIKSADGRINWTGTIANNGVIVFVIPGGIDESIQFTLDTVFSRTLTTAKVQGNGVISPTTITGSSINTTPVITTAVPNSQYTVVIS